MRYHISNVFLRKSEAEAELQEDLVIYWKGCQMDSMERKLPIGVQSFPEIIQGNYLYVDKTEYIFRLVHTGKPYFLSRPRRFGKSLLLSTMRSYWEGRKELFRGLAIDKLEEKKGEPWQPHPVFYFDFNRDDYTRESALEDILEAHLSDWENEYGIEREETAGRSLAVRFQNLLKCASEKAGKKCVVLVDEYDKPLLDALGKEELVEHNKAVFKGVFSSLKSYEAYIAFVFITGVTKFSKISIFSDLNQLRDISMNAEYANICGITDQEMRETFLPEIRELADEQGFSTEECLEKLRRTYDGYCFHQNAEGVYNPYSLLNAFADREFDAYWFETGTPTFLVKRLREMHFDVRKFTDRTLYANRRMLKDYQEDNPDPIPLLYQSGYLTIVGSDARGGILILGFPNEEVRIGFLESLMPAYVTGTGAGSGKDIYTLRSYLETADLEGMKNVFTALFASIPYTTADAPFEHYFQTVIYIVFTLLGQFAQCEMHTWTGRIDCVVETKYYIYIFEFKRDKGAEDALQQIEKMRYAEPFAADARRLFKIGVNFDSESRMLTEWKAVEQKSE